MVEISSRLVTQHRQWKTIGFAQPVVIVLRLHWFSAGLIYSVVSAQNLGKNEILVEVHSFQMAIPMKTK